MKNLFLIIIIAFIAQYFLSYLIRPQPPSVEHWRRVLVAHRAGKAYACENTLHAIDVSVKNGAKAVEIDIQLTADLVPVVIHNVRLDGVSDRNGAISELRVDELRKAKLHYDVEKEPGRCKKDSKIPLLSEVLDKVRDNNLMVLLDIKEHVRWAQMADTLVEVYAKYDLYDRAVVGSFNPFLLWRVRKEPRIATLFFRFPRNGLRALCANDYAVPFALPRFLCAADFIIDPIIDFFMDLVPYVIAPSAQGHHWMAIRDEDFYVTDGSAVNVYVPNDSKTREDFLRRGKLDDVVLGFDTVEEYKDGSINRYFGCTVGRVCNRIGGATFELNGEKYTLPKNNNDNCLHGGIDSMARLDWKVVQKEAKDEYGRVVFQFESKDGEEGFPGNLTVTASYTLEGNTVKLDYEAKTDKETPINLTNHAYFNLNGAGNSSILQHTLTIEADQYTPVDDQLIPLGKLEAVADTVFDFRTPHCIGERIESLSDTSALGYDHNYVLKSGEKNGDELKLAVTLVSEESGRRLRVRTTEPGVQFYSGNFLSGVKGRDGKKYEKNAALCIETQHFPNSPNVAAFPSIFIKPDQTFESHTQWTFDTV